MSNYCCSPYQNPSLDCNKVLDCLNQLLNVLNPPIAVDSFAWANMPLTDRLQYILDNLGKVSDDDGGGGTNPPSTLPIEVVSLNSTEFTKTFTQGSILQNIIIDTPIAADFLINIGKSPFGAEIEQEFPLNGLDNPPPFIYNHYFRNAETWYFSGMPSIGKIIFVYNLLV